MRRTATLVATGVMLVAASQTTYAQALRFGPDGITLEFPRPPEPPPPPPPAVREEPAVEIISRREATEIAASQGIVEIRAVDRDDTQYTVRGLDEVGAPMRVTIDGVDGRVLEVVRRQAAVVPEEEFQDGQGRPPQRTERLREQRVQPRVPQQSAPPRDPRAVNVGRDSGVAGPR